jgi:hypothetical protein
MKPWPTGPIKRWCPSRTSWTFCWICGSLPLDSLVWRDRAACATAEFKEKARLAGVRRDSAEVFFPITEDDRGRQFPKKAKERKYTIKEQRFERVARSACSECPVRVECLLETMELENEPYGIAGGLDAENRAALLDGDGKLHKRECQCGTVIYGVKGLTPDRCSKSCNGKRI